ncbi:MAG: hypothetical protein Ta2B_27440 [Termitinemataceae bacterium]|nr:MAG: hypothetical protein Ta2B_27440 [Termitinemataceae bacterium]
MKKRFLVLAATLFVVCAADAFSFGIGAKAGVGIDSSFGGILVSPLARNAGSGIPFIFGVNFFFNTDYGYFNLLIDYWIANLEITDLGSGMLCFYFGLGELTTIATDYLGIAIRVPIGLDFDFRILDIFFEIVPQLGINMSPFALGNDWVSGAVGIRVWI